MWKQGGDGILVLAGERKADGFASNPWPFFAVVVHPSKAESRRSDGSLSK
jgi:hypothetical protein